MSTEHSAGDPEATFYGILEQLNPKERARFAKLAADAKHREAIVRGAVGKRGRLMWARPRDGVTQVRQEDQRPEAKSSKHRFGRVGKYALLAALLVGTVTAAGTGWPGDVIGSTGRDRSQEELKQAARDQIAQYLAEQGKTPEKLFDTLFTAGPDVLVETREGTNGLLGMLSRLLPLSSVFVQPYDNCLLVPDYAEANGMQKQVTSKDGSETLLHVIPAQGTTLNFRYYASDDSSPFGFTLEPQDQSTRDELGRRHCDGYDTIPVAEVTQKPAD